MPPTIQGLLIAFVVLLVAFRLIDLLRPKEKRLALFRRGFWTDVAYWAFTPLVTRAITRACVIVAIVPVALLIYGKVDKDLLLNGFGPASRLPLWLQAVLILMLGDFVGYWMHRCVSRRAPMALPCRAPLLGRSRLAVGRAPAPGQRRADARGRHAADPGCSASRRWPWPASRRS